jgi:hypothetical protein
VRVLVNPGIQPVHDGVVYRPGDVADLPQPVAYQWVGSGWAVKADSS